MTTTPLTDLDVELLISGTAVPTDAVDRELMELIGAMRVPAAEPAPSPSAELALVLAGLSAVTPATASKRGLVRRLVTWFAGLGLGSQLAVTAASAAAAVGMGGAAGVLPAPAQHAFDDALHRVGLPSHHGPAYPGEDAQDPDGTGGTGPGASQDAPGGPAAGSGHEQRDGDPDGQRPDEVGLDTHGGPPVVPGQPGTVGPTDTAVEGEDPDGDLLGQPAVGEGSESAGGNASGEDNTNAHGGNGNANGNAGGNRDNDAEETDAARPTRTRSATATRASPGTATPAATVTPARAKTRPATATRATPAATATGTAGLEAPPAGPVAGSDATA